jgi:flagellar biosynthesis GTPase FlhF
MTNEELVSIIQSHRRDSLGYEDGDLSSDRAKAMDHYYGRPYGNEVEGRSQVVSRDLAEGVDGAMPAIMKVFVQSGVVAEFDPVGPEDEEQARQESDYVNQVIMKDNAGFMVLHDVIKDILILKNGYGKHWWSEEEKISTESFTGLSMDQITKMFGDWEAEGSKVEVVEQDSKLVEMPGHAMPNGQQMEGAMPGMPPMPMQVEVFDLKVKITSKRGKVKLEAAPPEELRVSKKCRGSLQDSPFTEHVTRKTRSALREMGMSEAFVDALPAYSSDENSTERNARDSATDESGTHLGTSANDRSMDEIEFCEAYVKVDFDGDGIAELRKVVTCANKIPPGADWNEAIESVAITGGVAKRVPHRHVGESLDDDLAEVQEILTTLKRQLLDNIYHTNNSELAFNERVNPKDMMTSTPGGRKRVKGMEPINGSIVPIEVRSIIGEVMPVIQHYKQEKEDRSGVSRAGQGLDPDVLRDATKGAYLENLNRLSQKLEMMTRLIAETFVKELVLQVRALLMRHQDKPRMVQLRGKWVEVNPKDWKERTDVTVRVGLGTGNEEEKRQKLFAIAAQQDRLGPLGMVGPKQAYDLFADIVTAMGFDMPEKYALSPESPEFAQMMEQRKNQPNPQMQIEQMKAQAKTQADMQANQAQMQLERERMQMQAQVDANRQQQEAAQQQAKIQNEKELAILKEQLADQRAARDAEYAFRTAVEVARINAESRLDAAQVSAQATLSAKQEAASDNAVGGA